MKTNSMKLDLLTDEFWWGGIVRHCHRMPYGAHEHQREESCAFDGPCEIEAQAPLSRLPWHRSAK